MRRVLFGTGLVSALVCPALAADDKDPDKDKPDSKEIKEAKDKLVSAGKITGKLTRVDGSQKYLTVQVTLKVAELKHDAPQHLVNLQRQLAEAGLIRNPVQRQQRIAEIQGQITRYQTTGMYTTKDQQQKFELQATDDVKVRMQNPPVDFDDSGKPKKYTAKELKELKGPDPKLPGYTADFDSLKQDMTVDVYVAKPKSTTKSKSADKDKDKDASSGDTLRATMIVILSDPSK
jgi:hypothetical protein